MQKTQKRTAHVHKHTKACTHTPTPTYTDNHLRFSPHDPIAKRFLRVTTKLWCVCACWNGDKKHTHTQIHTNTYTPQ